MTKVKALVVAMLVACATPVSAQMHATVLPDRITFGADFVPRPLTLPNVKTVATGASFELPADSTWDYLEVAGKVTCSTTHDTVVRFTHFFVLPGGELDCAPGTRKVTFVVRDVAIDTAKDPFQWGNGLLNFGKRTMTGATKTPWCEAVGDLAAGATTLTCAAVPVGWNAGDELLIPDTLTPTLAQGAEKTVSQREATVSIKSISGGLVTLSKGLDFAHPNIRKPDGTVVLRPRVANLTRSIVIRSENAANPSVGTRGHTADVGMGATWDIRYTQFVQLGRTSNEPLNDFVPATGKIGTNQRGRYALHHHHAGSSVGSADVGNTLIGNPTTTKWALAVHGTSDVLVEGNIAVDFPGAGFVTEDGYEVRNIFRKNIAAYILSTPPATDPATNIALNRPGAEGVGFWFRGVMQTIEGNEAWNNYRAGIMFFSQNQPAGLYPSVPGGMLDTPPNPEVDLPISFKDNVFGANNSGFEIWGVKRFPYVNVIAGNNYDRAVFPAQSHLIALELVNPLITCELGKGPHETTSGFGGMGVHSADGYVGTADITGGSITGCAIGIGEGGSVNGLNVTGTTLQNIIDIPRVHRHLYVKQAKFVPLGNLPKHHIELVTGDFPPGSVWACEPNPQPAYGINWFQVNRGSDLIVEDSPGFGAPGKSYRLYMNQAKAGNCSPYSEFNGNHVYSPPAKSLTMQQVWDRFGMGFNGGVAPATATTIDGLNHGVAAEGTTTALPQARAVITYPNNYAPLVLSDPRVQIAITGDQTPTSGVVFIQVDGGGPKQLFGKVDGDSPLNDQRGAGLEGSDLAPGEHTLKAWLTTKADPLVSVPGSEHSIVYTVPGGPPPTLSTVPGVLGLSEELARGSLLAAELAVGTVNHAESADVPVGLVSAQLPAGGAKVAKQTPVSFTVSTGVPTVVVPNVVGFSQSSAFMALTEAGLKVGKVEGAASATVPTGRIISQSPAATATVPRDSAVDLIESTGPVITPPPSSQYLCVVEGTTVVSCAPLVKR